MHYQDIDPQSIVTRFFVPGKGEPAGSKSSFVLKDRNGNPIQKDGRVIVNTVDANPRAKDWKRVVAAVAHKQYGTRHPVEFAVGLSLEFVIVRPKGHFRSGKNAALLKESAPYWHTSKPDVLKLTRGVEDALTGIVWRDDAQIASELISKRYSEWRDLSAPCDTPGVYVTVFRLPDNGKTKLLGTEADRHAEPPELSDGGSGSQEGIVPQECPARSDW